MSEDKNLRIALGLFMIAAICALTIVLLPIAILLSIIGLGIFIVEIFNDF